MRALSRSLPALLLALAGACTVPPTESHFDGAIVVVDAGPGDDASDAGPTPDAGPRCDSAGSTIGAACEVDADCDDACFCNGVEACVEGTCAAGADPCAGSLPDGAPSCVVPACLEGPRTCAAMPDHARCDDGEPCNGTETCSATAGCLEGEEPSCDDDDSCTVDRCEPGVGCAHEPRDLDLDGHADVRCGGDDCDDDPRTGGATYPGVGERCENRRDDDCDGALDFEDTDCVPTNDDCASAIELAGSGSISGTTRDLDADLELSCAPSGPDAVYRVHLDARADIRAEVSAGTTTVAVALRPLASCDAGPDLRCSTRVSPSLLARNLAPGDYALIVRTPLPGPFTLDLSIEPPTTPPENDRCAPTTDELEDGVTVEGRFDEVADDVRPACRVDGGRVADAVYRLDLDAPSDVVITASLPGTSGWGAAYLSLVSDCDVLTSALACVVDRAPIVRRRALPAGTYFVVLEAEDPTVLEYQLTAQITPAATPAAGDACASAIDVPESGRVVVPVASLLQDGGTSCGGASGGERDAVLRLTLDHASDVRVRASADGGSTSFVALRTECDALTSDLACRADELTTRALAAGTYALVVTTTATTGDLVVDVERSSSSPASPGDHCESAVDVSAGARISGSFAGASDDLRAASCAAHGQPDAFYRLSLASERRVLVFAETDVPGTLAISLRSGGCAGPELVCRSGVSTGFEQVLPAGEHYLAVEGAQATPGAYRLRVYVESP